MSNYKDEITKIITHRLNGKWVYIETSEGGFIINAARIIAQTFDRMLREFTFDMEGNYTGFSPGYQISGTYKVIDERRFRINGPKVAAIAEFNESYDMFFVHEVGGLRIKYGKVSA